MPRGAEAKMATTYKCGTEIVTLKRESVQRARDAAQTDARDSHDRGPTRTEREMGWTARDVWEWSKLRQGEADRLTKVLACVDAGVPELPLELYPNK